MQCSRRLHPATVAATVLRWRAKKGPVWLFAAWALWAALPLAHANEGDHERARGAVQAGEVLPLSVLLERLQQTHPGQVLELELERDDGRWIYAVKLLQPGGQVVKLELDARTAVVLKQRPKGQHPAPGSGR